MERKYTDYSPKEELLNVISHAIGLVLSFPATIAMIIKAMHNDSIWQIVSVFVYGISMILLYLASTLYHAAKKPEIRKRLNVFDHAAIYLLIAGTYTPFLLISLRGNWGWSLFGIVWTIAFIGITLKILYLQRYKLLSAIAYVAMGWIIVIAFKPLVNNVVPDGLFWLMVGGISYTLGAAIYVIKKIPYNHAIFHVFVLGGSVAHWIAVFYFVL